MNRYTQWIGEDEDRHAIPRVDVRNMGYEKCVDKLARYEDAEEQGTLVKLPCKAGDSVFIIVGKDISKQKVKEVRIFDNRIEFVTSRRAFGMGDFVGNVFLTRKEAEEQLEILKAMYF